MYLEMDKYYVNMSILISALCLISVGWTCQSQSQSYITTDSQSASSSWCQAPIWDPRPIFLILSLIIF
jgi:hypothetical protein